MYSLTQTLNYCRAEPCLKAILITKKNLAETKALITNYLLSTIMLFAGLLIIIHRFNIACCWVLDIQSCLLPVQALGTFQVTLHLLMMFVQDILSLKAFSYSSTMTVAFFQSIQHVKLLPASPHSFC